MDTTPTPASETRAFPIARADLDEEIRCLRQSPRSHGHVTKALLRTPDLRLVLMVLDHGAILPDHHVNGSSSLHVLDGRVVVSLLGSSFDLTAGQLLAIERGVTHSLVAIEDCAILLTVAWAATKR